MPIRYLAYHEAGHAIAAAIYGVGFKYVTIRGRPGSRAHVYGLRKAGRTYSDWLKVLFAGQVAATIVAANDGMSPEDANRIGWSTAVHDQPAMDAALSQSEWTELPPGWAEQATEELAACWPLVEAVAERLLAHPRRLTRREVIDIIDAALPSVEE